MLPAVLIEAFAEAPCNGNGAAVVLLQEPATAAWMQAVAGSLRQSETAFLLQDQGHWLLRWFTTGCEVPLCGHATLAALLALRHWGHLAPGASSLFHTRSGPLAVALDPVDPCRGSLVLPSSGLQPAPIPAALTTVLVQELGQAPLAFWTSPLGYATALLDPSAALEELGALVEHLPQALRPGLVLMQALTGSGARPRPRVSGEAADYQLRFFAPGLGIDEDPVTGSAHALVAPWWQEQLGRSRVIGWQCSDRPGGVVCEAHSSAMIRLIGSGHLLWEGNLLARPAGPASPHSGSLASSCEDAAASWFSLCPGACSVSCAPTRS